MFGLFKRKNPYEQPATRVYAVLLERVREPAFYTQYGVPDTQDARFDLLVLHVFIVMNHLLGHKGADSFNQALFDVMFADMDQSLREIGIGDTGIPKRMRRMMKAFNGRMHAYRQSLDKEGAFLEALHRNVYAGESAGEARKLAEYMQRCIGRLSAAPPEDILGGAMDIDHMMGDL